MGNCMDSCRVNEGGAEEVEKNNNIQCESRISRKVPERRIQSYPCGERNARNMQILKETVKGKSNNTNNGKRVKMVLTKEELQWLMLQLRNRETVGNDNNTNNKNNHYKRIEDVLLEIEKGRKKLLVQNWKPSLDSISELPEFQEMHK